ncbi:MAG: dependent helicase, Lhr family [Nitrososphaeraceae archaeon]|jgi:ATP-dependent Lhr-like helicase|nr:dependent helicase, Lhr family [Nitrososphaeraceae archaeon]
MKSQIHHQLKQRKNKNNRPILDNSISFTSLNPEDLEKVVINQFNKFGFPVLTSIQNLGLKVIVRDYDSLLVAPTGSGKTEAAIVPIIKLISLNKKENGIKAIYVTPLRALNNDVLRRIVRYAEEENLTIEIRHGDTSAKNKKKITDNPPDILITTPESLAVLLTISNIIKAFQALKWIVIDEVHELVPNERGSHLSLSIERLQALSTHKLTRIGLSATLGNLKEAGSFVAGSERKCAILQDKSMRQYDLDVKYIQGTINDVSKYIVDYIQSNKITGSVLLFTNTRDEAEYFGTILKNQKEINIDVHHGSLSREVREDTESKLRSGVAGIVVCTSSLELGLDIGSVDLVIHYGSPRQVSKLMQRIGRSRHQKSKSAKGLIITNVPDDEIEAYALVNRMKLRSVEEQPMHLHSLDVLAHHLVGFSLETREDVQASKALSIVNKSYPFRNLSFFDIDACLDLLDKNGIIKYDHEKQTYKRRIKSYKYYFENLSMIPFVLKFQVIDIISKKRIGTLDQKFVGDYGEKGNVFVLKGAQWRIVSIDENKLEVNVEPLYGTKINVPYWVGELIPVDYNTSKEVGMIRNSAVNKKFKLVNNVITKFAKTFDIVPDSKNIVVESSRIQNQIVIHSTLGTKVNNTLASLFSTMISSKLGQVVETRSDPYRILLTSSVRMTQHHIESVLGGSFDVDPILIASFGNTYHLNWKVWMVSKRFGMISKEALYDKKIARMIYDKYSKTPISKESIRELIHDKYNTYLTKKVLEQYKNKEIKLHWFQVDDFSELAKPVVDHSTKFSATPASIETGILELVKERLLKTKQKLICIRCGKWERTFEVNDVPDNIICPYCKSKLVTSTFWYDNDLRKIITKKLIEKKKLPEEEDHKFERAWKVSSLINNFGKQAVVVLAGHGIGADTAARILRDYIDDEEMYKQIYKAERQYIITRGFWDN